jgi:hypothetical protein
MAANKTTSKTDSKAQANSPAAQQAEPNTTVPIEKGAQTPETKEAAKVNQEAQKEAEQVLTSQQEQALAELEQRHQKEREALKAQFDPNHRPIHQEAFDATAPRGPEAPYETLKPSQRQGQGIIPPPAQPIAPPPALDTPATEASRT